MRNPKVRLATAVMLIISGLSLGSKTGGILSVYNILDNSMISIVQASIMLVIGILMILGGIYLLKDSILEIIEE